MTSPRSAVLLTVLFATMVLLRGSRVHLGDFGEGVVVWLLALGTTISALLVVRSPGKDLFPRLTAVGLFALLAFPHSAAAPLGGLPASLVAFASLGLLWMIWVRHRTFCLTQGQDGIPRYRLISSKILITAAFMATVTLHAPAVLSVLPSNLASIRELQGPLGTVFAGGLALFAFWATARLRRGARHAVSAFRDRKGTTIDGGEADVA